VTVELAALATGLAVLVGIPLGLWSGLSGRRRGAVAAGRIGAGLAMSIPDFVLGSVFLYLFSKYPLGLTVGTWVPLGADPIGNLRAVALPAITLSMLGIGLLMATTRHGVLGILAQDFITAAVARGKSPGQIVRHHILRNTGIPVVTVVAIFAGYLLGGTVIVETLYSVPGLGRHLVQAVLYRDYPIVQAGVLLIATFFIIMNVLADLAYAVLDPRLGARR
jgi:peptide/nickel transport system permease protein